MSDLAAATGNLDFGGHKGVNVADPGANQDAATKKYHDDNKYTDAEAVAAMGVKTDTNPLHHDKMIIDAVHIDSGVSYYSVPNNSTFLIDWGPGPTSADVEYDYGGLFSETNSDRITIKKAGLYLIVFKGYWSSNAGGSYRCMYIYKNGVFYNYVCTAHALINITLPQTFIQPMVLNVNDYIDVRVYQNSGGALNFACGSTYLGLWVTLLREI